MDSIGVDCSPITPLTYRLFFPLHSMKPEPKDQYEKVSHKFRWMNTGSALGIEVDPNQLMDNVETLAKKMNYQEFMLRAAKLLGRDEYGKKTIHHVILATDQEIRDDLDRHKFNPRVVSSNHKNWVWLDQKYSLVTFMWDEGIDAYRFHFHQGFVLLEAAENKNRFLTIPVDVKFINDEASLMNVSENDVYLKEIVEKFNEEQELIRTQQKSNTRDEKNFIQQNKKIKQTTTNNPSLSSQNYSNQNYPYINLIEQITMSQDGQAPHSSKNTNADSNEESTPMEIDDPVTQEPSKDLEIVVDLPEPPPRLSRGVQFNPNLNETALTKKSSRLAQSMPSLRVLEKAEKEQMKQKQLEAHNRRKDEKLARKAAERERKAFTSRNQPPEHDSIKQLFSRKDPKNVHRVLVEQLLMRFDDEDAGESQETIDAFKTSLTDEDKDALKRSVQEWSLSKGINFRHPGLKGHTVVLSKLNKKRREILTALDMAAPKKLMGGIERELNAIPFLARNLEASERIIKSQLYNPSSSRPPAVPSQPRQQTATTLLTYQTGFWKPDEDDDSNVKKSSNNLPKSKKRPRKSSDSPKSDIPDSSEPIPKSTPKKAKRINMPGSPESPSCSNEKKFMDILPLDGIEEPLCSRPGCYEFMLPEKGYIFQLSKPAQTWKCFLNNVRPHLLEQEETDTMNFSKSIMTQDQIRSLQYFNDECTNGVPNFKIEKNVVEIKAINTRLKHIIYSIGATTAFMVMNQLKHTEGDRLWHKIFIQQFFQKLIETMRIGIKTPKYPEPPMEWTRENYMNVLEDTIQKNVIFFDEWDFPEPFRGLSLSWNCLKNKQRTKLIKAVHGNNIHYKDLECFLPTFTHGLTFVAFITIIRLLLRSATGIPSSDAKTAGTNGLKELHVNLSWLQDIEDLEKNPQRSEEEQKKLNVLRAELEQTKKSYIELSSKNDFIKVIQWTPFGCQLQHEVIVMIKSKTGTFEVFSPHERTDSTKFLNNWTPFGGTKKEYGNSSLFDNLMELQKLMDVIVPREGGWQRSPAGDWPCFAKITNNLRVGVLKKGDHANARLLLLAYIDDMVSGTRVNGFFAPWPIATPRGNEYEIENAPDTTTAAADAGFISEVQRLIKYTQNFAVFDGKEKLVKMPDYIIKKMFSMDAFYVWSMGWIKLRYFEMIRRQLI